MKRIVGFEIHTPSYRVSTPARKTRQSALRVNQHENVSDLIRRLNTHPRNIVLLHTIAARASNTQLQNLIHRNHIFEREWIKRMIQSRNVSKMFHVLKTHTVNDRHKIALEHAVVANLLNAPNSAKIQNALNTYSFSNNHRALLLNALILRQFTKNNRQRIVRHLQTHIQTPMVRRTIASFSRK